MTTNDTERMEGVKSLNQRLKRLESKLQERERENQNLKSQMQQQTPLKSLNHLMESIEEKRQKKQTEDIKDFEDKYFMEIARHFDLSKPKSDLVKITIFTVKYVADNAVILGQIIGYALTGSMRYDLCLKLLSSLFTDVAEDLLGSIIQHSYNITYTRQDDTRTIQILHEKEKEINHTNTVNDDNEKKALPTQNDHQTSLKRNSSRCVIV